MHRKHPLALLMAGDMEDQGAGGGWSWVLSDLKSLLETGVSMAPEDGLNQAQQPTYRSHHAATPSAARTRACTAQIQRSRVAAVSAYAPRKCSVSS